MRVIIAGGRYYNFTSDDYVALDELDSEYNFTQVICGCAAGADIEGARWAQSIGIYIRFFPALWHIHGKAAGPIRNEKMAQNADALIAFPGNRGTENMVNKAQELGLKIWDWRTGD